MSDDDVDLDLLTLLRQSLGLENTSTSAPADTGVLRGAQFIYDNSIDVALDMQGTKSAAQRIWKHMQERAYSTEAWSAHELHPKTKDENTVNFIFTMDLMNFSFWSYKGYDQRFTVEYRGKKWTGYWSLVAALQRAIDEGRELTKSSNNRSSDAGEGIPITSPSFWHLKEECTDEVFRHVFRSATEETIPLFDKRLAILREAAEVLCKVPTVPCLDRS
jgi:hypothetical protein